MIIPQNDCEIVVAFDSEGDEESFRDIYWYTLHQYFYLTVKRPLGAQKRLFSFIGCDMPNAFCLLLHSHIFFLEDFKTNLLFLNLTHFRRGGLLWLLTLTKTFKFLLILCNLHLFLLFIIERLSYLLTSSTFPSPSLSFTYPSPLCPQPSPANAFTLKTHLYLCDNFI